MDRDSGDNWFWLLTKFSHEKITEEELISKIKVLAVEGNINEKISIINCRHNLGNTEETVTPLILSLTHDTIPVEITKILLDNGANVNTESGLTSGPVIEAGKSLDINKLKLLSEYGGNINEVDESGNTALIEVVMGHHCLYSCNIIDRRIKERMDIIKFFLKEGINYNHKNNNGHDFKYFLTPLIQNEIEDFMKEYIPINIKTSRR